MNVIPGTVVVNGTIAGLFGTSWGIFSECEKYRYHLAFPTGEPNQRIVGFCLANPSDATPDDPDPTATRCVEYARRWGFGWAWIVNVRAWRERDPKKVPEDPLAIGPENDRAVVQAALGSELFVCGWGKLGGARGPETLDLLRRCGVALHALKLNGDGSPTHPLYLRGDLKPFEMGGAHG